MKLDYQNISDYFKSPDDIPRIIHRKDGEPGFILPWEKSYSHILGDERVKNVKKNIMWLEKNSGLLENFLKNEQDKEYDDLDNLDIDASIYTKGLFSRQEQSSINMFHSLDINQKMDYLNSIQDQRVRELGLRIIFRNYPEQLDDNTREIIVSSIIESSSINIKKEKRRTPKNAIDEANKIIQNDDIDKEQTKIINNYIVYLQSLKA